MGNLNEYKISEQFINKKKSLFLLIGIIIPIFIIILYIIPLFLLKSDLILSSFIFSFIISTIILEILLIIIPSIFFKKYRNNIITISNNKIIKKEYGNINEFLINDDTLILKNINKSGSILGLKLSNPQQIFSIFGYENMDEIFNKIDNIVKNKKNISEKEIKYSEDTLFDRLKIIFTGIGMYLLYILIMVGSIILLTYYGIKLHYNIIDMIDKIIPLTLGFILIFFKPISRRVNKFKSFEIILGILLIGFSVISVVLMKL